MRISQGLLAVTMAVISSACASAQATSQAMSPATASATSTLATEVKKAVVYLKTDCQHEPRNAELGKIHGWFKPDSYVGTAFIVYVPDQRLGENKGFTYLVTNRHLAQPGIESGRACNVLGYSIALNRKSDSPDGARLQTIALAPKAHWYYSEDPSVDLAVTAFPADERTWDYSAIPVTMFASRDQLEEGSPVVFAGLFVQYSGNARLEPALRTGTLSTVPERAIPTTLRKPGQIYLAQAQAFSGNSGSPMFVNTASTENGQSEYKFFGVLSGEVQESPDLALKITAGSTSGNSSVSVVTPADEVKKLLLSPALQQIRDASVSQRAAN